MNDFSYLFLIRIRFAVQCVFSLCFVLGFCCLSVAQSEDQIMDASSRDLEIVDSVLGRIPEGITATLKPSRGALLIELASKEVETVGARHSSSDEGIEIERVRVFVKVVPRFAPALRKLIEQRNDRVRVSNPNKEETTDFGSKLIEMPMFENSDYGFIVEFPSRIPACRNVGVQLVSSLAKVASTWKIVDSNYSEKEVEDLFRNMLLVEGSDAPGMDQGSKPQKK